MCITLQAEVILRVLGHSSCPTLVTLNFIPHHRISGTRMLSGFACLLWGSSNQKMEHVSHYISNNASSLLAEAPGA